MDCCCSMMKEGVEVDVNDVLLELVVSVGLRDF